MKYSTLLQQGTDFTETITVKTREGSLVDFSGASAFRAQMRRGYFETVGYDLGITALDGGTTGRLRLSMSNITSATLKPGIYVFDVEVVSSSNTISRPLEGQIEVTPEVTR